MSSKMCPQTTRRKASQRVLIAVTKEAFFEKPIWCKASTDRQLRSYRMEQRTKQALTDLVEALKDEGRPFDLPDIPDFPDDFNIDDINRQWEEMNKR